MHVLIADAHYEGWGKEEEKSLDYWQQPEVREEIVQAARLCLSTPQVTVTPRTVLLRNTFAFCFLLIGG